jgi:hypothetical protein
LYPSAERHVTDRLYNLSFTAASLRPDLARVIAENVVRLGNWEQAKRETLATNALQARTPSSGIRIERELRQRLQTLTQDQLTLLASGSADERVAMTWLAMLKYNAFVFEFASELLRDKLAAHDTTLRPSDYEAFISAKASEHPELQELKETSRIKVRNVLLRMLTEVGILTEGDSLGAIQRTSPSPAVLRVIRDDDPTWLAGFLFSDAELRHP